MPDLLVLLVADLLLVRGAVTMADASAMGTPIVHPLATPVVAAILGLAVFPSELI